MGKCKTKAIKIDSGIFVHIPAYSGVFRHIQTYPDIIKHIQEYSGIIQAYSEPCVTLECSELWYIQNHGIFKTRGIFRTLVYPKLWDIQNQRHIQNPGLFRPGETYSEPCQTPTMEHFEKQLTAINIFTSYTLFLQYQLFMFSRSWNKYDFLIQI